MKLLTAVHCFFRSGLDMPTWVCLFKYRRLQIVLPHTISTFDFVALMIALTAGRNNYGICKSADPHDGSAKR